jgi:hypothetical protein
MECDIEHLSARYSILCGGSTIAQNSLHVSPSLINNCRACRYPSSLVRSIVCDERLLNYEQSEPSIVSSTGRDHPGYASLLLCRIDRYSALTFLDNRIPLFDFSTSVSDAFP